jgi:hypothetical protein
MEQALISLAKLIYPHAIPFGFSVDKLWISKDGQFKRFCYDVLSSLKERSGRRRVKLTLLDFRIIPGDWGKVRSGWLTWLLYNRAARRGEAEFTSSSGGGRTPSNANEGLGSKERTRNRSELSQVIRESFGSG